MLTMTRAELRLLARFWWRRLVREPAYWGRGDSPRTLRISRRLHAIALLLDEGEMFDIGEEEVRRARRPGGAAG